MRQVVIPYLWAIAVTLAFFGLGHSTMRWLRVSAPWAVSGGLGISLFVAFGGWLNLIDLVRPAGIMALVLLGDISFFEELYFDKRPDRRNIVCRTGTHSLPKVFISAFIVVFLACLVLANVKPEIFNRYDDPQAYMAFPQKLLQLGSLPSDPFSERRILTSVGGGYFLQAMMLIGGDERSLAFIDSGFGFLLYSLAIWAFARVQKLTEIQAVAILYLIPILPLFYINLTFVALSAALFLLALLMLSVPETEGQWRNSDGIILGVILGAVCTLKSANIVFAVLFLILFATSYAYFKRTSRALLPIIPAVIAVALTAFPWMLQQKLQEGTFLFPILGKGFHVSAYGRLPAPSHTASMRHALTPSLPHTLMLMLALVLVWKLTEKDPAKPRAALLAFFAAAACATPVIALSVSGVAVDRFTFPFQVPALLIFAVIVLRAIGTAHFRAVWLSAGCLVSAWCMWIIINVGVRQRLYIQEANLLATWVGAPPPHLLGYNYLLSTEKLKNEEDRAKRAQAAIPVGASVYEAVFSAYPYDFKRNAIYIADYPGMAGLPPGIPIGDGPIAVRDYFVNHSIRYILCDRRLTWDNQDIKAFLGRPEGNGASGGWTTMEDHVSRDVRHNLRLLANKNRRIYDDGQVMVIRLK